MNDLNRKLFFFLNPLIGLCDALTGLGLLLSPSFILQLLGIEVAQDSLVYLQYIGAFVFAVGLSYFIPYCVADHLCSREQRILYTWIVTSLFRLCIASFVLLQVILEGLVINWLIVAMSDALLAGLQIYLIKKQKA